MCVCVQDLDVFLSLLLPLPAAAATAAAVPGGVLSRQRAACWSTHLCEEGASPPSATLTHLALSDNTSSSTTTTTQKQQQQEQGQCEVRSPQYERDLRCGLCQVYMAELEVRLHLHSKLNDKSVLPIVRDTCRRLVNLPTPTYIIT